MAGCQKETPSYYELGAEDLEGKNYQSAIENFELAIAEEKYIHIFERGRRKVS